MAGSSQSPNSFPRPVRRCAQCKREFTHPSQWMADGRAGIMCKGRQACLARQIDRRICFRKVSGGAR
jgi:hypothetical protein